MTAWEAVNKAINQSIETGQPVRLAWDQRRHNELHARAEEFFETEDADVCTGAGWRVEMIRPKRRK